MLLSRLALWGRRHDPRHTQRPRQPRGRAPVSRRLSDALAERRHLRLYGPAPRTCRPSRCSIPTHSPTPRSCRSRSTSRATGCRCWTTPRTRRTAVFLHTRVSGAQFARILGRAAGARIRRDAARHDHRQCPPLGRPCVGAHDRRHAAEHEPDRRPVADGRGGRGVPAHVVDALDAADRRPQRPR